ncbi:MAG TPA: ABC transporter permease, partial [Longimicrobiales bacterium]|nr:ABC transporter permease [Longimicrobiales bacterium]
PGQPPGFSPPSVAILSHALWRQRYGGDPDVVGRRVDLGGNPVTVVGVLPADFELHMPPGVTFAQDADLWTALRIDPEQAPRGNVFLTVLGRLEEGATLEQARTDMERVAAHQREIYEGWENAGFGLDVVPLQEHLTRAVRPVLWALMGAVAFVLLIACANVSNLLLVRATTRERELAIRSAMGGSRGRLLRQMLLESGVLAGAGALLGLLFARAGIELLLFLRPEELPRIDAVSLDGSVLLFTVAAAAAAALVFGTAPAMQGSRPELAAALRDRAGTGEKSRGRRLRNGVVVAEVALSLVLLIGTGLMVRSFLRLQRVDPGFRPENVLTFDVNLPQPRYPLPADRARMNARLQERLRALPGVEEASGAIPLPLSGVQMNGRYGDEEALNSPDRYRQADYRGVLPGYFEALGTRLLEGRTFTPADQADSASVVVVDEKLARALWPNESAVGRRFVVRATAPEPQWVEVIGVVEHQRHASLAEEGRETVYFTDRFIGSGGFLTWALRTSVPPLSLVDAVRREVQAVDAGLPLARVRSMESYVDDAMAPTRFALILIAVFGVLALILASIGLYGVLAYAVRQRTAEIGVRMAFGAEAGTILRMVVGRGLALSAVGVVLGLGASLGLTRLISGMLVGVGPTDPVTFAGISLLFLAVAATACWIPARRATRVDPALALREE